MNYRTQVIIPVLAVQAGDGVGKNCFYALMF